MNSVILSWTVNTTLCLEGMESRLEKKKVTG